MRLLTGVLFSLLFPATALAQVCQQGVAVPAGTQCGITDFSVGGAVADANAVILCQQSGGCPGSGSVVSITQQPMSALATYFKGKLSGTAPVTFNPTTGTFGLTTPSSALLGGTGTGFAGVTVGSGLNLTAGTLTATGTSLVIPTADLLGGNGSIFGGVTVGSGLNITGAFGSRTLTASASAPIITLGAGLASTTGYNPGTQTVTGGGTISRQLFAEIKTANCTVNSTCGSTNDSGKLLIPSTTGITFTLPSPGPAGSAGFTFGRNLNGDAYSLLSPTSGSIYGCGTTAASGVSLSIGPPAYDVAVNSDGTNWHCTPFGGTGGSPGGATSVWTGTVTGTNTYASTPGQTYTSNAAYNVFCGTFANASTGASTLNLGAGPVAINVQVGNDTTRPAGAGDIPGGNTSICLQLNAGATAWVKQTQVPGAIRRDPGNVTVSAFEWATGATFIYTTGAPTLTFPVATSLSTQGGVTISALGPVTLQPNAADGINGNAVGLAIPTAPYITTVATTSGASGINALTIPPGETKIFPVTWGPGANLAAAVAIPVITRGIATQLVSINCVPGGLLPAAGTIDIWHAANTVQAINVTTSGTKLTTTACDAAAGSGTLQAGLNGGATPNPIIPAGNHIWMVAAGAGWGGTITAISGKLQISLSP